MPLPPIWHVIGTVSLLILFVEVPMSLCVFLGNFRNDHNVRLIFWGADIRKVVERTWIDPQAKIDLLDVPPALLCEPAPIHRVTEEKCWGDKIASVT
jgi:hypothetical protein